MVTEMKSYTVTYERDDSNWWVASIKSVPGCHTQGRTIDQARRRIREALGLFIENSDTVELKDDVILPNSAKRLLEQVKENRKRAERESAQLQQSTVAAARMLTQEIGVSIRDAGELLGLSHQRIHQILQESA
jgi:predicted RNase H-like HicB family nuclease